MRTLVIHPEDPSTDFLKGIYENIDCRVLRNGNDFMYESLKTEILQHDRIIMLGHGTRFGLMSLADHSYIVSHLLGKVPAMP